MEKKLINELENLKNKFTLAKHINNTYRLNTPFFHRINGEIYDIFVEIENKVVITDLGATIERLLNLSNNSNKTYTLHKISTIVEKYGCILNGDNIEIIVEDINYFSMYLNMYMHAVICVDNILEIED